MRQPVVFVTDFGRDDAYAAALVGAAWGVDPHAVCVEGTHGIPPGDVLAGAYQLKALARAFTAGAVFCAGAFFALKGTTKAGVCFCRIFFTIFIRGLTTPSMLKNFVRSFGAFVSVALFGLVMESIFFVFFILKNLLLCYIIA